MGRAAAEHSLRAAAKLSITAQCQAPTYQQLVRQVEQPLALLL
jgi:hypothetical protein